MKNKDLQNYLNALYSTKNPDVDKFFLIINYYFTQLVDTYDVKYGTKSQTCI